MGVKMNLQLSSNILGCHEREERALISVPSTSTSKLLEDLLPQSVVTAFHNALPNAVDLATTRATSTSFPHLHRLELQHGAPFALTASPSLILCPLPTQSSSESLVASGALLLMFVSRIALVGLLHSQSAVLHRRFAPPTKSLVWSVRLAHIAKQIILLHLK